MLRNRPVFIFQLVIISGFGAIWKPVVVLQGRSRAASLGPPG
jgi:hypothetical protein